MIFSGSISLQVGYQIDIVGTIIRFILLTKTKLNQECDFKNVLLLYEK